MRLAAGLAVAALLATAPPSRAVESSAPAAAPAAPKGLARFTNHARFVEAEISPKGTSLAVVSTEGGLRSLTIIRLSDRKVTGRLLPGGTQMIGDIEWANDERLVASLWQRNGTEAKPVSYGELVSVKPDGRMELIFGFRAGQQQTGTNIKQNDRDHGWADVVTTLRGDAREVVITTADWAGSSDKRIRLARLDVYNGRKTDLGASPLLNARYLADEHGEPRVAWARDEAAKLQISVRGDDKTWRPLTALGGITPTSRPVAYRADARILEVVDGVPGGFGVFEVSLDTGARTQVAFTKIAPPREYLRDGATRRLLAVESEPDLPDWQFVDEAHPLSQLLAGLLDANPGAHVRLASRTEDGALALATVTSDRDPGRLFLVDVAKRSAELLLEVRPWIDPAQMAETNAFHIKASDGHPLHGYFTLPPGLPAGARAPLVVVPHGGPFSVRDHWAFDTQAQLFASRGYAVLRVNFRGSGGYGERYEEDGFRRWGGRVTEDILDATRWLIGKGRVDPARVAIYGGSFGGYAAMQAASLAPDLFRCAVGFAGVYDLTRLEGNDDVVTSSRARAYVRVATGDDEASLEEASPAFHADRLRVPVLLVHGGMDTRVPIAHAEALRDALTRLGRPPEWLDEPTEGHGFYDEAARLRMYEAIVGFLDRHTAPKPPAPPAPKP